MVQKWIRRAVSMVRELLETFYGQFGPCRGRTLAVTSAACAGSAVAAAGKLLMSLASLSFFACVSAFYSFGMVVAKVFVLAGLLRGKTREERLHYCKLSGWILVAASLMYMLYAIRLILNPAQDTYHLFVAIGIAAFTFAELGISLHGVAAERRRQPPFFALKTINLASALLSLVLTRQALLSLSQAAETTAWGNMIMGVLMSLTAMLLGANLIARITREERYTNYRAPYRRLRRALRASGIGVQVKPVYLWNSSAGDTVLGVLTPSARELDAVAEVAHKRLKLTVLDAARLPLTELRKQEACV